MKIKPKVKIRKCIPTKRCRFYGDETKWLKFLANDKGSPMIYCIHILKTIPKEECGKIARYIKKEQPKKGKDENG